MQYIECPKNWKRLPGQPSVFLAGGITGCPDWQNRFSRALRYTNYAVLNPRRRPFPINEPSATGEQIKWEFEHLQKADVIAFWFCKESIQPIALFELGAWSRTYKTIIVGASPEYIRFIDINIQMGLLGIGVFTSLDDVISKTISVEKMVTERLVD